MGGMGAAIATAFSYLVIMIIRMIDVRRFITLDIDLKRFIIQFVLLALSVGFGCIESIISVLVPTGCCVALALSDYQFLGMGVGHLKNLEKEQQ